VLGTGGSTASSALQNIINFNSISTQFLLLLLLLVLLLLVLLLLVLFLLVLLLRIPVSSAFKLYVSTVVSTTY